LFPRKIEKNEIGGACSAYGERRGIYRFWVGKSEKRDHMGDPGVVVRIIFRWIFRKCDIGM